VILPAAESGARHSICCSLTASQHFTQPPPRYNEASLVKTLEKEGHRPAQHLRHDHLDHPAKRGYVELEQRRFFATELGKTVTDLLVNHFPNEMDLKFTSSLSRRNSTTSRTVRSKYADVLNEFWDALLGRTCKKADAEMPTQVKGQRDRARRARSAAEPLVEMFSKRTGGDVRRLLWLEGEGESLQLHQASRRRTGPERDRCQVPDLR
jgi:DNA topoisomerase I